MALSKRVTTESMVEIPAAYYKVEQLHYSSGTATVHLAMYASEEARQAEAPPVEVRSYVLPLDVNARSNWLKIVYAWLRKQDEFEGATDA